MLSIKNLVKVYKTKGGAEVRALDDVSVDFPEKGMVFLLGKSGSGKSTLLNVAGGLDKPDRGEVIVKGKSSKSFSSSDFDSYRNTYVGFVFQEYNILDEFNIEQNIALALQLQGKKNDKEAVNNLLKQVDLTGLGKRKPNTLSGGQKQRVAIARALIKEPEIIMADEPTGALDSNTGKQVFDTLKKLSADKLVIVVSHDREFAEQYADRIIELKDGKILSDTSKALAAPKALSANVNAIGADTVRVKDWNKLTQNDFNQILAMMKGQKGEVIISSSEADMPAIKRVCKISDDGSKEYFEDTDRNAVKVGQYDASRTKFIKSKMPAARAIKMGASGLKTKPVRLFFTILLSVLSFAMFGVLSTMMMYDPVYSVAAALEGSPYQSAALSKKYKATDISYEVDKAGNKNETYRRDTDYYTLFGESELAGLNENSEQLKFAGAYNYSDSIYDEMISYSYGNNLDNSTSSNYYFTSSLFGFTDCGAEYMQANNFVLLGQGRYPAAADEIAVSNYVYEQFKEFGYINNSVSATIENYNDLIGKTINLRCDRSGDNVTLKITGIYNVGEIGEEYNDLKKNNSSTDPKKLQELINEFQQIVNNSFYTLAYVSPEFYSAHKKVWNFGDGGKNEYISNSYARGMNISESEIMHEVDEYSGMSYFSEANVKAQLENFVLYNADGDITNMTEYTIGKKDVYVPAVKLYDLANSLCRASKQVDVFIDRNGNEVENQLNDTHWEYMQGFYADGSGNISLTPTAGYAFLPEGRGYVNADGEFMDNPFVGWNHSSGIYYLDNQNKIHIPKDQPDASWTQCEGNYYYRNGANGEEYTLDPSEGWLQYNGYIATGADGSTYVNGNGYMTYYEFYADGQGNLSSVGGDGYTSNYGFYVDKDGNTSLQRSETFNARVNGFWLNANGEVSLTKKPGYSFVNSFSKHAGTGKILFGEKKFSFCTDGTKTVSEPYYGLVRQDNRYKSYKDYPENADFYAACMRLKNELGIRDYNPDDKDDTDYGAFTAADIKLIVSRLQRDYDSWLSSNGMFYPDTLFAKNSKGQTDTLNIVGYYMLDGVKGGEEYYILADSFVSSFAIPENKGEEPEYTYTNEIVTSYRRAADAKYNFVITLTKNTQAQTHFMLDARDNDVFYTMNNEVYKSVINMGYMIESLQLVFMITGAVMAVLSALMLFNFISVSISAKRKEIGILRAVGARGSDVFKIFFAEAFIIALICFVLSAVAAGIVCFVLNGIFMSSAVAISVLNYGIIQILLILGISFVIAVIATILPVYFAAKKPPVESIRAL